MACTGSANTTKSAPCTASTGLLKPCSINPNSKASCSVFSERVDATICRLKFSASITRAKLEPISPSPINATFPNNGCAMFYAFASLPNTLANARRNLAFSASVPIETRKWVVIPTGRTITPSFNKALKV